MIDTIGDTEPIEESAAGSPPRLQVLTEGRPGRGRKYTLVPQDVSTAAITTTWITVDEELLLGLDEWQ